MTMMKAAVYRQFNGPIQIEQVPRPTCRANRPDGGDSGGDATATAAGDNRTAATAAMVIKVMATGVCRSDWHGWKGHDADIQKHGLPFCPGHEFAGIVVEMIVDDDDSNDNDDNNKKRIKIGDRVVVPFILSCGSCQYCQVGRSTVCIRQQQPGFTYWGSFAEYVALYPQCTNWYQHVHVLPLTVSFVQAAALGCRFTTAYRAVLQQGNWEYILERKQQQQKQQQHQQTPASMAVFGCGGVGLSCIMIAAAAAAATKTNTNTNRNKTTNKRQPIIIIAVDISQAALDKAVSLGATHTVLIQRHHNDSHEQVQQLVLQCLLKEQQQQQQQEENDDATPIRSNTCSSSDDSIMEIDGVDLAIDAAGFASTCEHAVYCTRRAGRMVQVGLPIDNSSKLPIVPMGRVVAREIEIYGSHGFVSTDLEPLLQMIASGTLNPARLVEKCVTLREGIQALQDMDRSSPLGITMITSFQESSKL